MSERAPGAREAQKGKARVRDRERAPSSQGGAERGGEREGQREGQRESTRSQGGAEVGEESYRLAVLLHVLVRLQPLK